MKNKGTGIQWHRIFGIAALMSVIVFAVMLYMDFGTSIKSMVGIGSDKTPEEASPVSPPVSAGILPVEANTVIDMVNTNMLQTIPILVRLSFFISIIILSLTELFPKPLYNNETL